jgi:Activator of Hsp90 ATPase homolog 1-like protein
MPNVPTQEAIQTIEIVRDEFIAAPIELVFETVLEQMGPLNERPDGEPLPLKLEAWPGGRWYRDLGDGNGHYWGTVQAIKRPTLLEICGPLFASYPLLSNLQYRLSDEKGGTLIKFRHTALGFIDEEHKKGVGKGWTNMLENIRKHAEESRSH